MSPEPAWPWSVLGLSGPADEKAVRSAYARSLKVLDQGTEIDKFQALRQAYDFAQELISFDADDFDLIETGFDEPAVPDIVVTDPPVVPPGQPEPRPLTAESEKDIAFQALIATLAGPDENDNAGSRIRRVLEHPLTDDPAFAPVIELAIRDLLLRSIADRPPPYWPSYINRETLRAIDERFHWLSDFRVFRARFGWNDDLKARLLDRAFGHVAAHLGPELDAARLERQRAYVDRVAFFLTYPIIVGLLLLVLVAERRFNFVPNNLVSRQHVKYLIILSAFFLSMPLYFAGEYLLRRADPFIRPRISAFQLWVGLESLPRFQRKVLFCGPALSALIAVIFMKVRWDYTVVNIIPIAIVVFLGVVVLNVLILGDVE